jgi:predicted TPR repeat methyltransferase
MSYKKTLKYWDNCDKMHSDTSEEAIQKIADIVIKELQLNRYDYVMDIGCGDGLIDEKIKHIVKHFHGIDFSEKQLIKASNRNPECSYEKASFFTQNYTMAQHAILVKRGLAKP